MPEQCSKCGVQEGVGCELTESYSLLHQLRKYCPICLQRLQHISMLLSLSFCLFLYGFFWWLIPASEFWVVAPFLAIPLIPFINPLAIVPHELGHAFVAKFFGYKDIRIVIGSGATVWSGTFLGFPTLFGRLPLGGLTLFTAARSENAFATILVLSAGSVVTALTIALIWIIFTPQGAYFPPLSKPSGMIFWSHIFVLVENLIPMWIQTSIGKFPNDGLQIFWQLFPRKIAKAEPTDKRGSRKIFRILLAILLSIASVLLFATSIYAFFSFFPDDSVELRFAITLLIMSLAGSCAVYSFFAWKQIPLNVVANQPESPTQRGAADFLSASESLADPTIRPVLIKAISDASAANSIEPLAPFIARFPHDPWILLFKSEIQSNANQLSEALETLDDITPPSNAAALLVLGNRISILIRRNQFDSAERLCEDFLTTEVPHDFKIEACDYLASAALVFEKKEVYNRLEPWIHRALEFSPDNPSLKATQAALQVELGFHIEAEKTLLDRIATAPTLPNRAFATFYLGLLRAAQGNVSDARRLLNEAALLHKAPWLDARVKAKLSELPPP